MTQPQISTYPFLFIPRKIDRPVGTDHFINNLAIERWAHQIPVLPIPWTAPAPPTVSTAPAIRPHQNILITGFSVTISPTSSSGNVVYTLSVNGTVIATVTITPGSTYGFALVKPGLLLRARIDNYQIAATSVGTSVLLAGGEIELS